MLNGVGNIKVGILFRNGCIGKRAIRCRWRMCDNEREGDMMCIIRLFYIYIQPFIIY